jgi:hypothetical protein
MLDAVLQVRASGTRVLLVGKSLRRDRALTALSPTVALEPVGDSTRAVIAELRRLLDAGELLHDGSPLLDDELAALVVVKTPAGPRLRPGAVVSATKAATWAARRALATCEPPRIF